MKNTSKKRSYLMLITIFTMMICLTMAFGISASAEHDGAPAPEAPVEGVVQTYSVAFGGDFDRSSGSLESRTPPVAPAGSVFEDNHEATLQSVDQDQDHGHGSPDAHEHHELPPEGEGTRDKRSEPGKEADEDRRIAIEERKANPISGEDDGSGNKVITIEDLEEALEQGEELGSHGRHDRHDRHEPQGGSIRLTDDVTIVTGESEDNTVTISGGNHSIFLDTFTLTDGRGVTSGVDTASLFTLTNGAVVTVYAKTEITEDEFGEEEETTGAIKSTIASLFTVGEGCTLNIVSGIFSVTRTDDDAIAIENKGTTNISGGTVKAMTMGTDESETGTAYGIHNAGTLNISGGTITGESFGGVDVVYFPSGSAYGVYNTGKVTGISNSTVSALSVDGDAYGIWNDSTGTLTEISNSTISAESQSVSAGSAYGIYNEGTLTEISGCEEISAKSSDGDANGIYNKGTITEISGCEEISATSTSGYAYGINNSGAIAEISDCENISAESNKAANGIYNEGTITEISSCTISAEGKSFYSDGIYNLDNGTIDEISNCTLKVKSEDGTPSGIENNGTITEISGCTIDVQNAGIAAYGIYNSDTIDEISNCTITVTNSGNYNEVTAWGIDNYSTIGSVNSSTITAVSVYGDVGSIQNQGNIELVNCTISADGNLVSASAHGAIINEASISNMNLINCSVTCADPNDYVIYATKLGIDGIVNIVGGSYIGKLNCDTGAISIADGTFSDSNYSNYLLKTGDLDWNTEWNTEKGTYTYVEEDSEEKKTIDVWSVSAKNFKAVSIADFEMVPRKVLNAAVRAAEADSNGKGMVILLKDVDADNRINVNGTVKFDLNGHTITAAEDDSVVFAVMDGGQLTLVDTRFTAPVSVDNDGTELGGINGDLKVASNGALVIDNGNYTGSLNVAENASATIWYGNFNGELNVAENATATIWYSNFDGELNVDENGTLVIYAGTYSADPGNYLAADVEGLEVLVNPYSDTCIHAVGIAAAENAKTHERYISVQAAVDGAGSRARIFLVNDTWDSVTFNEGKAITLDLNGYVLYSGNTALTVSSGRVSLIDTSDEKTGCICSYGSDSYPAVVVNGGWFVMDDTTVLSKGGTAVAVVSGNAVLKNSYVGGAYCAVSTLNDGVVFIDSCTLYGSSADEDGNVYAPQEGLHNNGTATVLNSTIIGETIGVNNTGIVSLSDCEITASTGMENSAYGISNKGQATVIHCNISVSSQNGPAFGIRNYNGGELEVCESWINADTEECTKTIGTRTMALKAGPVYGIYNSDGSVATVEQCYISASSYAKDADKSNKAYGIYNDEADITVRESNISAASVGKNAYGLWNNGTADVIGSAINAKSTSGSAYGISNTGRIDELSNCIFHVSSSGSWVYGIDNDIGGDINKILNCKFDVVTDGNVYVVYGIYNGGNIDELSNSIFDVYSKGDSTSAYGITNVNSTIGKILSCKFDVVSSGAESTTTGIENSGNIGEFLHCNLDVVATGSSSEAYGILNYNSIGEVTSCRINVYAADNAAYGVYNYGTLTLDHTRVQAESSYEATGIVSSDGSSLTLDGCKVFGSGTGLQLRGTTYGKVTNSKIIGGKALEVENKQLFTAKHTRFVDLDAEPIPA